MFIQTEFEIQRFKNKNSGEYFPEHMLLDITDSVDDLELSTIILYIEAFCETYIQNNRKMIELDFISIKDLKDKDWSNNISSLEKDEIDNLIISFLD